MSKKYLILTVFLLLLAGIFSSCGEKPNDESPLNSQDVDNESPSDSQKPDGDSILQGTKWKLEGIVDRQTGSLRELEPKSCKECFTLTFDTGYTATVRSINMNMKIKKLDLLNLDPLVILEDILLLELYDEDGKCYIDGDDFRRAILTTSSYSIENGELKLFYGHPKVDKKSYLLFKQIMP